MIPLFAKVLHQVKGMLMLLELVFLNLLCDVLLVLSEIGCGADAAGVAGAGEDQSAAARRRQRDQRAQAATGQSTPSSRDSINTNTSNSLHS